jgi:hypothetical protein
MSLNDVGIELLNNKSQLFENLIEKSHANGIFCASEGDQMGCLPNIWKNRVTQSGSSGIYCTGASCKPDIRGNVIDQNRKCGIKLCEDSSAHIGGTSKEDLSLFMKQAPLA